MSVILMHENVTLRPMKESDISRLWKLTTPEIFTHMLNQIQTSEEFEKWMEASYLQMKTSNTAVVFVVANLETDEFFGSTRIYNIDHANKSCEIGGTYYGKAYQRTHVNTITKWLLLTYAFETLGMIRVQFKTDEENVTSQKAIERLGATKEGIVRNERIRSTGKPRNAVMYSVIDSDWEFIKNRLEEKMNIYS
ncbi:GNAT family N-acetyltransferase [Paenisporosarcina sp. OV554]|uniref:GNAT family N-acetyltransferase n=1 Tax=Paenisporosarcina sp. OV554 TaxID=2135694 RepID=UPI000D4B1E5C|nr:GNAT family protein [Paenisporosarcina sp. OV554]PUB08421.1 RimJ/RimL family protein N-acetyltransferase [Paenisporosarcina sp. OV554]